MCQTTDWGLLQIKIKKILKEVFQFHWQHNMGGRSPSSRAAINFSTSP